MITKITMKGEVTIDFSEMVEVPLNYSSFNSSHLLVEIQELEDQVESWKVTSFTET